MRMIDVMHLICYANTVCHKIHCKAEVNVKLWVAKPLIYLRDISMDSNEHWRVL